MARTIGPLHSDDASGTFAKALTFAKWKGRSYVRQRVDPANPKSAKQVGVRAMMRFLAQAWATIGSTPQGTWLEGATAKAISAFNQFVSLNLARWQNNEPPSQSYPAAEASTPAAITSAPLTGHEGYATAVVTPAANADIWGVVVYRETAEITSPTWANCVAVIPRDDVTAFTFTDSPLAAGTYHYRFAAINTDGIIGTVLADASVVVT